MIDRPFVRDAALAVLLALPTAALSRPQAPAPEHRAEAQPLVQQAALAHASPSERRFAIQR
jgi:hypothetical protein